MKIFSVPREWPGETAFIIGGGPSIKQFDFERLRGRGRVIAVNNAGIIPGRATWADVLYFADRRWYDWNRNELHKHTGKYKISKQYDLPGILQVIWLPNRFSPWPDTVGGWCGGSHAINLAYHFGATRIVLLGFDMIEADIMNWHSFHQLPHSPGHIERNFIPALEIMAPELAARGVQVFNTNFESGLRCFKFASINDFCHL